MNLFVAGLSYRTAPVEIRERISVQASRIKCQGCRLKVLGDLQEVVIVSTCNRVEIYGAGQWMSYRARRLLTALSDGVADMSQYSYLKEGKDAVAHLFSVTSGMDSMVIGETEITGQVKQAYLTAQEAGLTGKITNRLFQTALQVAKQIRTQTAVGRGATSVGSVAVELAERIFDNDLSQNRIMIIGAGKMGEACLRHFSKKGASSITVANRSYDRAACLAAEFNGRAVNFEDRFTAMVGADIVVSSTGCSGTVLNRPEMAGVMAARSNRPLFLIDIAVPRDIAEDVQELPNVFLYNVDHLEEIVRENVKLRELELEKCRSIIAQRMESCAARLRLDETGATEPAGDGVCSPEFVLGSAAA